MNKIGQRLFVSGLLLLCLGCSRAPSVSVIGSFFPAWMICITAGIVIALVARAILVRLRLEPEVGPLALFYPAVVSLSACLLWLIFFG
jgi:hypothetical protein